MTEQQWLKLPRLQYELKQTAMPIGSMHPFWDVIIDIQMFIEGKKTILQKTADEWIEYAEGLLEEP